MEDQKFARFTKQTSKKYYFVQDHKNKKTASQFKKKKRYFLHSMVTLWFKSYYLLVAQDKTVGQPKLVLMIPTIRYKIPISGFDKIFAYKILTRWRPVGIEAHTNYDVIIRPQPNIHNTNSVKICFLTVRSR